MLLFCSRCSFSDSAVLLAPGAVVVAALQRIISFTHVGSLLHATDSRSHILPSPPGPLSLIFHSSNIAFSSPWLSRLARKVPAKMPLFGRRRRGSGSGGKLAGEAHPADGASTENYYDEAPQYGAADRAPAFEATDGSTMDPDSGVKRGLKNRHLSMMALAGIIGPGLLVGAGGALSDGGPASLLIGFGVIGTFLASWNCKKNEAIGSLSFQRPRG